MKLFKHCLWIFILAFNLVKADDLNLDWLDLELSNYSYPYDVSTIKLNSQGQILKMAYMDIKPDNYNGHNIILMHGKNFNGAYWETTISALKNQGYRVIVPDQIGFGKSSKPDSYNYSFQQLSVNTKRLLSSLDITNASVLGHSMGGMLAVRFSLMYPEFTNKLILVNPIGLEDWKLLVPYQTIDWWYENELKKNYKTIKNYQYINYYDRKWKPEYEQWVALLAGWTLNSEYKTIAWNAALTYDMIFTQPVLYEFSQIKSPTLLIIGTRDRTAIGKSLVSEEQRKLMGRYDLLGKTTNERIPNSQLVELKDIGHLPHIENFKGFITPLKEFLSEN